MAITKATLLEDIAHDLMDYGSFEVSNGSFLDTKLAEAMEDVAKANPWAFLIGQSTITTTQGNKGPYNVPADFFGLVPEKNLNKFYAYDQYAVPPSVADGEFGRRYPITYNEVTGKIYFFYEPGTGNKAFTYWKKANTTADLANWPEDTWIKKILKARTSFYALFPTPDFKDDAKRFWDLSEMLLEKEIANIKKRGSKPDTRTLRDGYGDPAYYALAGDC